MSVEPAVYDSVKIIHSRSEIVYVPEDLEGIMAVAEWIAETGCGETRDVGIEGFRYRSVYENGDTYRWWWASPGDWITLMSGTGQDREFDMPTDHMMPYYFSPEDWVSGPKFHE